MVLDPVPQPLPVHFFGSRPQPPTSQSGNQVVNINYTLGRTARPVSINRKYVENTHTYVYIYIHVYIHNIYRIYTHPHMCIVHLEGVWRDGEVVKLVWIRREAVVDFFYLYVHTHAHMHICMYTHTQKYTDIYIHIYVYIHTYMYIYTYTSICVYVYV